MSQAMEAILIFGAMIAAFFVASGYFKMPSALGLLVAGLVGAVTGGLGISVRTISEGLMGFYDIAVLVIAAAIFISAYKESKGLNILVRDIIRVFHKSPPVLLVLLMFIIILPGAVAGSGTAAVMAVGGMVGTVLMHIGLSKLTATSFVAMGGILALLAPPINLPAMIISSGLNMPYSGFFLPLLIVTVVLGVVCALFYGWREVNREINLEKIYKEIPDGSFKLGRLGAYLPLLVVVGLMVVQRVPIDVLDPGVPVIFAIGTIFVLLISKEKLDFLQISKLAIRTNGSVAAIFVAVGVVVQVMVTTGVRGFIVVESITAPVIALFLAVALLLPLMGGIMGTYGVASIFAIPFMMALLAQDVIYAIAGLSMICCLASLTPPTAIVGRSALLVTDYDGSYGDVLKKSAVPWIAVNATAMVLIIFANWFSRVF